MLVIPVYRFAIISLREDKAMIVALSMQKRVPAATQGTRLVYSGMPKIVATSSAHVTQSI